MENWTDTEMRKYARDDAIRKALDEAVKKQGVSLGAVYDGIVWPIQEGGVDIFDILRCEIELILFESHTDILVTRGGGVLLQPTWLFCGRNLFRSYKCGSRIYSNRDKYILIASESFDS